MKKTRVGVIGVGYLGKFHAEKYSLHPDADLVGVVDIDDAKCAEIASKFGIKGFRDYSELIGKVDAVSIVVPTVAHFEVAREFLRNGVHILLEKPITSTLEEAEELVRLANQKNAILQVGHLERFNPVIMALDGILNGPGFIESIRIAPFKPRGTDVNVVLDLMIHDIDIIQNIVRSPIKQINSIGAPVFTSEEDIANARIQFENGCVANVTASRISLKSERIMRIFQPDAYIVLDFQNKKVVVIRKGEGEMFPGVPNIKIEEKILEQNDALKEEILSFLECVRTGKPPVVSGDDGKRALETALLINKKL
ncbi:MAG TPA: Gfo/Idh/MocA family oxidoreductase [Geobacteraceae bacterium]|nr:Gfo/Idh/MocA family oxidoreductase [Geobacteraceae bacterium]